MMRVVLIGAGNLATNLGKALKVAGHEVVQVWSRTKESASTLASLLGCEFVTSLDGVRMDADVYIISVKDSALEDVAAELERVVGDKLFVHTAGTMSIETIGAKRRGVLYPMQTFSKRKEVDFSVIPTFVEASNEDDLVLIESLAKSVSNDVRVLSSENRKSLHVAAVFACNFANHCYALSEKVLAKYGLPFSVMLPLIDETACKVHECSPREAQTGPAARWDENVMEHHMQMLKDEPAMAEIYKLLSKSIHEL